MTTNAALMRMQLMCTSHDVLVQCLFELISELIFPRYPVRYSGSMSAWVCVWLVALKWWCLEAQSSPQDAPHLSFASLGLKATMLCCTH